MYIVIHHMPDGTEINRGEYVSQEQAHAACARLAATGWKCSVIPEIERLAPPPAANAPASDAKPPHPRALNRPQHLCALVQCAMREHPAGRFGLHLHPDLDRDPANFLSAVASDTKKTDADTIVFHLPEGLAPDGSQQLGTLALCRHQYYARMFQERMEAFADRWRIVLYLGPPNRSAAAALSLGHFTHFADAIIFDGQGDRGRVDDHALNWPDGASRVRYGAEPWPIETGSYIHREWPLQLCTTQVLGNPRARTLAEMQSTTFKIADRAPLGLVPGELMVIDNGYRDYYGKMHDGPTTPEDVAASARQLWALGCSPCVPFWLLPSLNLRVKSSLV